MLRCIIFIFRTRLLTFFILLIKRLYSAHANSLQKPETLVFSVCYIRKKYFLRKGIDSFFRAGARCGTPVTDQSGLLGAACRCLLVGRPTRASHFHTTAFFSSTYEIFSHTFVHRLQLLVGRETNKGFSLSHNMLSFPQPTRFFLTHLCTVYRCLLVGRPTRASHFHTHNTPSLVSRPTNLPIRSMCQKTKDINARLIKCC